MTAAFRVDSATPAPDDVILDLLELIYANGVRVVARRGNFSNNGASGVGAASQDESFHSTNVGTVVLNTLFEGIGCYQLTSAAGATNGRQGSNLRGIPMGANRSNDPTAALRPIRYILEALLIRAAPIVAATGFGYGFSRTNSLVNFTATPGIQVASITTVNGGNWSVYQRLVNVGALVVTDTGVPGTTRAFLRFIYDDTTNPRLQILLNGATVHDVTGLANVPALTGAEILDNGFFQGDVTLAGVGQVDRVRQCRFRMQALPGFPL